jgi:hypothetical protein
VNLFHAAIYTNHFMPGENRFERLTEREKEIFVATPHVLESYHYVGNQRYVDAMRREGAQVFLDSGAFSAHTLGVKISIEDYCNYIIRNRDIIRHEDNVCMASVLDGIGDDLKTWQNQQTMERLGACPLPCFHFGEDDRYLEWYVARYPYITIGGLVGKSNSDVIQWLDRIWERYMLDGSGKPRLKVHAFGVTRVELMERYPWHSVDSSSWIQSAIFGNVYLPEFGPLSASSKAPARHDTGRHLTTLSAPEKAYVMKYLQDAGFEIDRIIESPESRASFNVLAYVELNAILNRHFAERGGALDCLAVQQLF